MSNYLIMKYQPTLSINSVETDLLNYDYAKEYTNYYEFTATIAGTTSTAVEQSLPSPTSLPTGSCFIELTSDSDIYLKFNNGSSITLSKIQSLTGDIKGYNFIAGNENLDSVNITWRCFYTV